MIGIIGFGKMGEAMARAWLSKGESIGTFDIDKNRINKARELGLKIFKNNAELEKESDVVVFAVKPQVVEAVFSELNGFEKKLYISILAGVKSERFKKALGLQRLVRVMPNTPALVGEGAIALSFIGKFSEAEKERLFSLFSALGDVVEVSEKDMDAVTALSGSGPAYVFLFIESLTDAGVRVGLSREVSLKLALKTVKGSVKLLEETGLSARELLNMVTSPGGTTISALHVLERSGFKGIIMDAVLAADKKSKELGG